ncbi:MAG TPA: lipopolysaccharide biosynthesis protein [Gemmatimonadaceae bacterium]
MKDRQIASNAVATVVQLVVSAAVLFFLYRFLLRVIGVEAVGVWSLVLAITSLGRVVDPGIVGGTTRFVARARARGPAESAVDYTQTAALSAGAVYLALALLLYPILSRLLEIVVPTGRVGDAHLLLPYALLSFWLTNVAAVFQGGIDGTQRVDLKSILLIGVALVYFASALLLVSRVGLIGLGYAQVVQAVALLVGSWLLLRRCLPGLPPIPVRWRASLFREIVAFGSQLQLISLTLMLWDPTTKALLSRFGGLAHVGYYDMAGRLVQQVRALLVNANQVLVPTIADLHERATEKVESLFRQSQRVMAYLSLPLLSALLALMPLVSEWWIGHYEGTFVLYATLLAIGWFINILSVPAYFVGVGTGRLRWNVMGHVLIAIVNLLLGGALGHLYGGLGVVIAAVTALVVGSTFILLKYHAHHGGHLSDLFPPESTPLLGGSLAAVAAGLMTYHAVRQHTNLIQTTLLVLVVLIALLGYQTWRHPLRRKVIAWAIPPFTSA